MKFAGAAFQRQNILLAQFKEMPVPPPYVCLRTCCSSYCTRVLIALYSCCCKIISNIIFLFTIAYYFVSLKQGTTISLWLQIEISIPHLVAKDSWWVWRPESLSLSEVFSPGHLREVALLALSEPRVLPAEHWWSNCFWGFKGSELNSLPWI